MLLKAYKYRIYPNKKQKQVIDQTIETCRYLYNDFLNERRIMYQAEKGITQEEGKQPEEESESGTGKEAREGDQST
jgi:Helix-turn-helix domain.